MKIVGLVMVALLLVGSWQVDRDEIDSQVEDVSHFLLELINRYDDSGTSITS
jgi:hypothetical protein